jgi:histidine ammonia-lyase
MSDLPMFLTQDAGLNSGIMILQVTAASLVSENKILSHPASVDSIPTSADKEDHVSMGTIAARKMGQIIENVSHVIAIELFSAAQALDFLRPLKSSPLIEQAHSIIRKEVSFAEKDRTFYKDLQKIKSLMNSNAFDSILEKLEV